MQLARILFLCSVSLFLSIPASAQRWEFGIGAGAGIYTSQTIRSGGASAEASFRPAAAITAHIGQNMFRRLGGEIRYTWQNNQARLSSGPTTASFASQTHAIEYDLVWHLADASSRTRPYVLGGAGVKRFEGTGEEIPVQPLNRFAFLTRTGEWQPMVSVGAGVKHRLGKSTALRLEVRDQISPAPTQVIAVAPLAQRSGAWMHNFIFLVGLTFLF